MLIKFENIESKGDIISGDPIINSAIKVGYEILKNGLEENILKGSKLKVQKLKKNISPNYFGTILLTFIAKDNTMLTESFDLTKSETNKNFINIRVAQSWNHILDKVKEQNKEKVND